MDGGPDCLANKHKQGAKKMTYKWWISYTVSRSFFGAAKNHQILGLAPIAWLTPADGLQASQTAQLAREQTA